MARAGGTGRGQPVGAGPPSRRAPPPLPDWVYPLDYGYLEGTRSADGEDLDVWVGSQPERGVTGLIASVDGLKGDAEFKILLGCTAEEARRILALHNRGASAAILIPRPG